MRRYKPTSSDLCRRVVSHEQPHLLTQESRGLGIVASGFGVVVETS